mgnify:CR=1 FL=1
MKRGNNQLRSKQGNVDFAAIAKLERNRTKECRCQPKNSLTCRFRLEESTDRALGRARGQDQATDPLQKPKRDNKEKSEREYIKRGKGRRSEIKILSRSENQSYVRTKQQLKNGSIMLGEKAQASNTSNEKSTSGAQVEKWRTVLEAVGDEPARHSAAREQVVGGEECHALPIRARLVLERAI